MSDGLRDLIRDVPDFPSPGIVFKDITPLLADGGALAKALDALAAPFAGAGITHVAGIESRGFILATPVAERLGAGFVPLRKAGRLPWTTRSRSYDLEYGTATLEIHADAVEPGDRVLVVDAVPPSTSSRIWERPWPGWPYWWSCRSSADGVGSRPRSKR